MSDLATLEAVRERLVAAGSSDGVVTELGWAYSVHFTGPDGFEGEVNAVNPQFDPDRPQGERIESTLDPRWFDRILASVGISR